MAGRLGGGGNGILHADRGDGFPATPALRWGRWLAGEVYGMPLAAVVLRAVAAPASSPPLVEADELVSIFVMRSSISSFDSPTRHL